MALTPHAVIAGVPPHLMVAFSAIFGLKATISTFFGMKATIRFYGCGDPVAAWNRRRGGVRRGAREQAEIPTVQSATGRILCHNRAIGFLRVPGNVVARQRVASAE